MVCGFILCVWFCCFFFQAEDGIRDAQESRGLGDVYKRQAVGDLRASIGPPIMVIDRGTCSPRLAMSDTAARTLSLIHI